MACARGVHARGVQVKDPAKKDNNRDRNPDQKYSSPGLRYFNRDLSWLAFNARVLAEAEDPTTPLLEKLKFLSIFSSNLDEFFMVRVAGIKKMLEGEFFTDEPSDEATGGETLAAIRTRVMDLVKRKYECLHQVVLPELRKHDVEIVSMSDLKKSQRAYLEDYFFREVFPVLTPMAVDPAHPFPFLTNLSLYLLVMFKRVTRDTPVDIPPIGLVEIPTVLPRLIPIATLPGQSETRQYETKPGETRQFETKRQYILLEDLVEAHLGSLFIGFDITATSRVRVTRNLDYKLLENEVVDLLKSVQREVTSREHQEAVRLDFCGEIPPAVFQMLLRELHITEADVYEKTAPLMLNGMMGLYQLPLPNLKDPPFNPRLPRQMESREDIFSLVAEEDLLLHHPYDSFYPTIEFLQQAAHDPAVLAIKQTLYRTSGDSPIIDALIAAAENGKQVTAVVELKARFDEKNNITWARRLERAGVNVVFGFVGLKTHCKMILVVRRESGRLVRYVNLSTGNYNSNTAKLYTDLSLFTVADEIGEDISTIFNLLTGFNILTGDGKLRKKLAIPQLKKLALAPTGLRERFLELIGREAIFAKKGVKARIVAKMNALVDREIIDALYAASAAGVEIKLIVRGVCCLRPGVPGLSDGITVISVVDRFLEHSRIFYFEAGGKHEVYLSSADWMSRNMDRRIEVLFPIEDPDYREGIINNLLNLYLLDNVKARVLLPDGRYLKRQPANSTPTVRSQTAFIELARSEGIKSIPYDEAMRHDSTKQKGKRPVAKGGRRKS